MEIQIAPIHVTAFDANDNEIYAGMAHDAHNHIPTGVYAAWCGNADEYRVTVTPTGTTVHYVGTEI